MAAAAPIHPQLRYPNYPHLYDYLTNESTPIVVAFKILSDYLDVQSLIALKSSNKKWRILTIAALKDKGQKLLALSFKIIFSVVPNSPRFKQLKIDLKNENNRKALLPLTDPRSSLKKLRFEMVQLFVDQSKLPHKVSQFSKPFKTRFCALHHAQRTFNAALGAKNDLRKVLEFFLNNFEFDFYLNALQQMIASKREINWNEVSNQICKIAQKLDFFVVIDIAKKIPDSDTALCTVRNIVDSLLLGENSNQRQQNAKSVLNYINTIIDKEQEPYKSWLMYDKIRCLVFLNKTEQVLELAEAIFNPVAKSQAKKSISLSLAKAGMEEQAMAIAKTLQNPDSQEQLIQEIRELKQDQQGNPRGSPNMED